MHALAVLSLVASTALVAAQQETYAEFQPLASFSSPLEARQQQDCASVGGKACGSKCIQITYTCCGNGQGACRIGYSCGIAANGIYGCCPVGKRCRGDAPEPSTTIIGGSRPTSSAPAPGGGDDDEPTDTPTSQATSSTTRRLTPVTTSPSRTTPSSGDEPTSSAVPTSGSGSSGSGSGSSGSGSGSSGSGSGSGSSNNNGNGNSNGGGNAPASSAGIVGVSLASLASGIVAAIVSLL